MKFGVRDWAIDFTSSTFGDVYWRDSIHILLLVDFDGIIWLLFYLKASKFEVPTLSGSKGEVLLEFTESLFKFMITSTYPIIYVGS